MQDVLDGFARERCSAILRTPHASAVVPAMRAAIDGGFRIVEFTLTTPDALDHIAAFSKEKDLLVGAGTVLDLAEAEAAREAGARFLVSPVVDERIIRYGSSYDLLVIPGCFTPTEMLAAHRAGAPVVKLFPAPADGPAWIRACLGPLPFLKVFPTAGVTAENARPHLEAGAFGVGFVGNLFAPDDVQAGSFDRIRERAREMVAAVRSAQR
jgi:Entner-Doudoroff aldolase